jgi:ComF family protein
METISKIRAAVLMALLFFFFRRSRIKKCFCLPGLIPKILLISSLPERLWNSVSNLLFFRKTIKSWVLRWNRILRKLANSLESFLLPGKCEYCGLRALGSSALCIQCIRVVIHYPFSGGENHNLENRIVISRLPWCPQVRSLIHGYKYSGRKRCLRTLLALRKNHAKSLEREILGSRFVVGADAGAFVPVPPHGLRVRERGHDATWGLAQDWAEIHTMPAFRKGLCRIRHTYPQAKLSAEERRKNLEGALVLGDELGKLRKYKTFVLIDDVMTTGSTLSACAEVIQKKLGDDVRVIWFVLTCAPKLEARENGMGRKNWEAAAGFFA